MASRSGAGPERAAQLVAAMAATCGWLIENGAVDFRAPPIPRPPAIPFAATRNGVRVAANRPPRALKPRGMEKRTRQVCQAMPPSQLCPRLGTATDGMANVSSLAIARSGK
jgi:hypothetical protein